MVLAVDTTNMKKQELPRKVTILGSTGSIGCNTVKLLQTSDAAYEVIALTAHRNVTLLAEQARALRAKRAVIADQSLFSALKEALNGTDIEAAAGKQALIDAASCPTDWMMSAIVGMAGLEPTLAGIRQGAVIALANKECLVSAGALMMQEIKTSNATVIPVDSEHSAIFQVLDMKHCENIDKITLTASGGPFRNWDKTAMRAVTLAQAIKHPNWKMGRKISIDSATMMNKGLEFIEAYHLFPVTSSQIDVVVHPESVIHSMVTYTDGSVLAQLGTPDMCTPIAVALAWPHRMKTHMPPLDLTAVGRLTFEPMDNEAFPALNLARSALDLGGAAPAILNAANEIAVAAFIEGDIGFLDIVQTVEKTLDALSLSAPQSISEVIEIDQEARKKASGLLSTSFFSIRSPKPELQSA